VDEIFYEMLHNGSGEEWQEHEDGSFSLNIDRVLDGIYIKDVPRDKRRYVAMQNVFNSLLQELYPEDPRQMKFGFADEVVESLLANTLEFSGDPSPAAKVLVGTIMEGHSYSCVMINLPDDLCDSIIAWGKQQIPNESLFVDKDGGLGREEETHVTVKYGLFDAMPSPDLLDVFKNTNPFEVALAPISLFRNDDFDVVKLDVNSAQLHELNRKVSETAPHHDTHPDYKPHVTIAYVKKGTCDRLEGVSPFDNPVKLGVSSIKTEGKFDAKSVIFSSHADIKREYPLGKAKVGEAMTPADLVRTVGIPPEEQPLRVLRRRVSRELIDSVWVQKVNKPDDGSGLRACGFGVDGELIIFFRGKQSAKSEFCSFEVLKSAVRQWRNLYGVRLFVNGSEAGTVSYNNPALQDAPYTPSTPAGGV
jgi:2'-5' RNA ligase